MKDEAKLRRIARLAESVNGYAQKHFDGDEFQPREWLGVAILAREIGMEALGMMDDPSCLVLEEER